MATRWVWYELVTTDAPAAARFYEQVIGWKATEAGAPGFPYTVLSTPEPPAPGQNAGVAGIWGELGSHRPPSWLGYLGVPDVDEAVAQLSAAGGTVTKPVAEIPSVGRFAIVADPTGAHFILFQGFGPNNSATLRPPTPPGTLGHCGWHELQSSDLDAAWSFYSTLYGWGEAGSIDMGPAGPYRMFTTGSDAPVAGGMMRRQPEVPVSFWLFYFRVASADRAAAAIAEGGGQVLRGPHQVPTGEWIVLAQDPHGAHFAVVAAER